MPPRPLCHPERTQISYLTALPATTYAGSPSREPHDPPKLQCLTGNLGQPSDCLFCQACEGWFAWGKSVDRVHLGNAAAFPTFPQRCGGWFFLRKQNSSIGGPGARVEGRSDSGGRAAELAAIGKPVTVLSTALGSHRRMYESPFTHPRWFEDSRLLSGITRFQSQGNKTREP
jgi:hypothetical protein